MLHYILQIVAFQLFFLIIYDVFLKKETFFNCNRFYLLITAIASIALPFIKFESIRTIVPEKFVIRLPEVIIGDVQSIVTNAPIEMTSEIITNPSFIWSWEYLLYAGMVLASLLLIYKIIKISILIQKNPKRYKDSFTIVYILKSNAAFSFFNYIFLGEWIKDEEKETILKHELVHVSQKHSLDLLLFELMRILFWFNPLIYMYQNRLTTLHEYIADAQAMKLSNKKHYYEKLLSQVFDTESISFTNTFFRQSLIKKRILMLSKSKSHRSNLFKYALLIPMVFGILAYTSSYSQESAESKISQEEKINQKLTDKELQKKLYDEIIDKDKNGEGLMEINTLVMSKRGKYINSRTEYYRFIAYTDYIFEKNFDRKLKEGSLLPEDFERAERMKEKRKTYQEYLEWKQTDESKEMWEKNNKDGVLRIVVDDIKNLTEMEQIKYDEKMNLIRKDDSFNSLMMTDGNNTTTVIVEKMIINDISSPVDTNEIVIIEESIEVPFSVIDQVPSTEDCKNSPNNEEKRQCLANYISDFVNKNFNTDIAKEYDLKGKQRISVLFKIGKDGIINDVKARAPHPALEAEAKRVIKLLPQMIPGRQKGIAVTVPYSLPILFQVQGSPDDTTETSESNITFSNVEVAPISKECQIQDSEKERRSCTMDIISSFVNENFNTKIAKEKGLTGMQRIVGFFRIDERGFIIDVQAKAQNEELQLEALKVLSSLPQMIPGKQKGKPVVVSYSLPILIDISE